MEKILVSEIDDGNGTKIISAMEHPTDWRNLEDAIRTETAEGRRATVKFYERTRKWVEALPEYQG